MQERKLMWILILLSMAGGMAIAAQALINARLKVFAGNPILAATVSFAVGLIALLPVLAVQPSGSVSGHSLGSAPWWAWIGGALGASYIVVSIYAAPRIGAAALLSAVVLGQLSFSLVADHFGFFGISAHAVNAPRLVGVVLVTAGVVLVRMF
jgi:transporter family-2 protein